MLDLDLIERFRELLNYEPTTGHIFWRVNRANQKAGVPAGNVGPNGYRTVCVDYRAFYAHHIAIALLTGQFPASDASVDHINGDRADNRIANLRITTPSRNGLNRARLNRNNTSGIT